MFKKFLPKEDRFFTLFKQHPDTVMEGIDLFELLLKDYAGKKELAGCPSVCPILVCGIIGVMSAHQLSAVR